MKSKQTLRLLIFLCFLELYSTTTSWASLFGEETAVLIEIAANQATELSRLAENIGIAKEHRDLLIQVNEGINRTTQQIQSIEAIIKRAEGLDPTSVRNLSQLNEAIENLKLISGDTQELVAMKLELCDEAVNSASMQSDTAYKMGQEMEKVGAELAIESQTASPGRASQISASALSAQMLATGVELQTLSQISQLLALNLDLQKSQIQKEIQSERSRRVYFESALSRDKKLLANSLKGITQRTRGKKK